MKKSIRMFIKILLTIIIFIVFYVILAVVIPYIGVNKKDVSSINEVTVYIKTNGVHTDIVVPIRTKYKDWSEKIKFSHIKSKDVSMQYIGFGWGDKGFYLNTPEWSDLKFSTAFFAATGLGTSAMHATFFKQIKENESCVKISISAEEYQKLIAYIETRFDLDQDANPVWIDAITYGQNDSFYEAKGSYNLFYSCNTWANNALKAMDQKAALWTVTDKGIFYHYK